MPADGYRLALYLRSLKRLSAIPADYIDLPRGPDDGAADWADIFDAAVDGFLAAALGGSLHGLAAGIDFVLAYDFNNPCLGFRGQCCYRPAVFVVLLDMKSVGLGGGLEFKIVVVTVVAYVLNVMLQVVEMPNIG